MILYNFSIGLENVRKLRRVSATTALPIKANDESKLKIIRALDVNEGHGHDNISIQMIKLCDKSIIPELSLIYKNYINSEIFPNIWKKSKVVTVHKKGDKQVVENYRPVSLFTNLW